MFILNHPEHPTHRWNVSINFWILLGVCSLINTLGVRLLPLLESTMFLMYIFGFFGILIPLIYLGPQGTVHDIFGTFLQDAGWKSKGVTLLVGSTTTMFNFTRVESASHMAEEVEDAAFVIPSSMISAVLLNGLLGFGMLIAMLFVLGDVQDDLTSPTGLPFIQIIYNAVMSKAGTTGMVSICIIDLLFQQYPPL